MTELVANDRRPRLPDLRRHLEIGRIVEDAAAIIARTTYPRMRNIDWDASSANKLEELKHQQTVVARKLSEGATLDAIDGYVARLRDALRSQPDRGATMAAVALLVDSKARQPANPPIYIEATVYDLVDEGFPPCVVALACQRLRRELKFLPEIAEIVTACRAEHEKLEKALVLADSARRSRAVTEDFAARLPKMIAEVKSLPEPAEEWLR